MADQFERKTRNAIERQEGDAPRGIVTGLVVTDGEASDGHILNIAGIEIPESPPLLFGHDDYSGRGNLGSWTSFEPVKLGDTKKLGGQGLRGVGQIELEGAGDQLAWREDVAHMIEKGHIGGLSIRWEDIDPPKRRVNLPSDHPAFIDIKKANGRQEWGLWFDKSRMLEDSVVTLGADPGSLIGRMAESEGLVRANWRATINSALEEHDAIGHDFVGVDIGDGEIVHIERRAYEAMLSLSNERLQTALDLFEEGSQSLIESAAQRSQPQAAQPEPKTAAQPTSRVQVTLEQLRGALSHSRQEQARDTAQQIENALDHALGRNTE
jgi:hypothetical protein